MEIIKRICRHKEYKFDITKFNFKYDGQDEYFKIISYYKDGKVFDYYSAYNNVVNYWIISYNKNMGGELQTTNLYFGKIPNKRFGKNLLKNILTK